MLLDFHMDPSSFLLGIQSPRYINQKYCDKKDKIYMASVWYRMAYIEMAGPIG